MATSAEFKAQDVARRHFARRHRRLFATEHWGVLLNKNQSYLGRSIVYLRRRLLENPLELTPAEREELWGEVMPRLSRALEGAFGPDRLNYSHLGNRTNLVHWHVVPRYEREPVREFEGRVFEDTRQGQNFRARKRDRLGRKALKKIAREVKAHLESPEAEPMRVEAQPARARVDRLPALNGTGPRADPTAQPSARLRSS